MIILALGIIIGILLTLTSVAFGSTKDRELKRTLKKLSNFIEPPHRVEFVAPVDAEAEAVADIIKENDEQGKDTDINEL